MSLTFKSDLEMIGPGYTPLGKLCACTIQTFCDTVFRCGDRGKHRTERQTDKETDRRQRLTPPSATKSSATKQLQAEHSIPHKYNWQRQLIASDTFALRYHYCLLYVDFRSCSSYAFLPSFHLFYL